MKNKEAIVHLKSMRNIALGEVMKEALTKAIEALEAQGWIPVTERLPESTDDVLVIDKYYYMFVAWYGDSWHSSDTKIDQRNNKPIIAWMPLPKPYKREETT